MDYRAIYDRFIDSRRVTEEATAAREYTERHHIEPRCLGGTNDNDNIIRLTYREHIFAHSLLLKGARSEREAWLMAASMSAVLNFDASGSRDMMKAKRSYTWARKLHGQSIRGNAHPRYKHDEHMLWKADGRIARGTRQELIEETGLPFRQIYDLLNGNREIYGGWCSTPEEAEARAASDQARATRHERIDGRLYNVDGRTIGKDLETLKRHGVNRCIRSRLSEKGFAEGWCLDPEEAVLRAEGRWRRAERKKSAQHFGSTFPEPISSPRPETGRKPMSRSFHNFVDFVAFNTVEKQTAEYPHAFLMPGETADADTKYATAEDWARAHKLWLKALADNRIGFGARKHAKHVMKHVRKSSDLADVELVDICKALVGTHGNSSTKVYTLHSTDGRIATGVLVELRDATGLTYERIRDLVSSRRRYVKGWALTEAEAKRGYLPSGRPRKPPAPPPEAKAPEPEFFQESGVQFF